ncbi:MAG: hypothetical protein HC837_14260, partial [Chloroflexaceae bacterium]|nr:hypothetical protein [Chloroflexaceae bacterium]
MRRMKRRMDHGMVSLLLSSVFTLLIAAGVVSPTPGAMLAPTSVQAQTITNCVTQTAVTETECEALLALYTATDGDNWANNTSWGQDNYVCSWYGITCTDGSVTSLNLGSNNLSGSIPAQLGDLDQLT